MLYVGGNKYKLYVGSQRLKPIVEALPYDAQIEYIEANGTGCYINTGISGSNVTTFEIDAYMVGTAPASGWLFGSRIANNNSMFAFMPYSNNAYSSFRYRNAASSNQAYVGAGRWILSNTAQANVCVATSGATTKTYSCSAGTFDNQLPIYLFCMNDNGTAAGTLSGQRLYSVKLWVSGVLVRDFIPVRVGQVGYMYDRVSKQLFGNGGTDSFILGNDVN